MDILPPTADLTGFRLVLAPALYVISEMEAENLRRYADSGGLLFLTARSGVKDAHNNVVNQPLPGLLADLCGVEVDEYDVLPDGMSVPVDLALPGQADPVSAEAEMWCDVLVPTTGQTVAVYRGEYYAGRCAAVVNNSGRGKVLYLGAFGRAAFYKPVVDWLLEKSEVQPVLSTPAGVEAAARWKDGHQFLFLQNHTDQPQEVVLSNEYYELIHDREISGTVKIDGKGVMILKSRPA